MTTRFCTSCEKEQELSGFKKRRGNKTGHEEVCNSCYVGQFPSQTPQRVLERVYKTRTRNRKHVWEYLLSHPCSHCGEADPIVLEFDHVRGDKSEDVSKMVHNTRSLKAIQEEIDKCDVLCANCHRRRTASSQEWDKAISFRFLEE